MPVPFPPIEPPPTSVCFPSPRKAGGRSIVAVGRDFSPGTLLAAYRQGIFPWPQSRTLVPWCSPEPRAIFPLEDEPQWPRTLRKTLRKHPFEVTLNTAFRAVMTECGRTRPHGTWILPELLDGYVRLHELGWAHSVEVWEQDAERGRVLVGGLYGVCAHGLFAGESMFHRRDNASKVAFVALVESLRASGFLLLDAQVQTDHLRSLGCVDVRRDDYLERLERALRIQPQLTLAAPYARAP